MHTLKISISTSKRIGCLKLRKCLPYSCTNTFHTFTCKMLQNLWLHHVRYKTYTRDVKVKERKTIYHSKYYKAAIWRTPFIKIIYNFKLIVLLNVITIFYRILWVCYVFAKEGTYRDTTEYTIGKKMQWYRYLFASYI